MSEVQPTPKRVFHISQKRAYTDIGIPSTFTGQNLLPVLSSHTVTSYVMHDVYNNAIELQSGVSIGDILQSDDFISYHSNQKVTGQHAIRRRYGTTLAALAVGLQWNLDIPEFVYMSGYVYQSVYEQAGANVLNQIERRRLTTAPTPEVEVAKQTAIAEMDAKAAKYNTFALKLRQTLAEYARQYLPTNPQYVEVLQELTKLAKNPNAKQIKHAWNFELGKNNNPLYEALRKRDEKGFVSEESIRQAHALLYS